MSARRVQSSQSVSLFPFLAVLVCAMGALIFLLLVTTHRIRSRAIAAAVAEQQVSDEPANEPILPIADSDNHSVIADADPVPQPKLPPVEAPRPAPEPVATKTVAAVEPEVVVSPVPKPQIVQPPKKPTLVAVDPNAELHRRIEQLAATEDSLQSEIQTVRQQVLQRQQDVATSQNALQNLKQRQTQYAAVQDQQQEINQQLQDRQKRAAQVVAALEDKVEQTRQQRQFSANKFAIIPFEGQTGTARRPIFVECSKGGLRFLPEDVELTIDQLRGYSFDMNPLLSGVRALHEYWSQQSERHGTPEPYVLLLVRPGGSLSFYAAQKLIGSFDESYGYELVEDDWNFELPPHDAQAEAICRSAVENLLAHKPVMLTPTQPNTETPGERVIQFDSATGRIEVSRKPSNTFGTDDQFNGSKPGNNTEQGGLVRSQQSNSGQRTTTGRAGNAYRRGQNAVRKTEKNGSATGNPSQNYGTLRNGVRSPFVQDFRKPGTRNGVNVTGTSKSRRNNSNPGTQTDQNSVGANSSGQGVSILPDRASLPNGDWQSPFDAIDDADIPGNSDQQTGGFAHGTAQEGQRGDSQSQPNSNNSSQSGGEAGSEQEDAPVGEGDANARNSNSNASRGNPQTSATSSSSARNSSGASSSTGGSATSQSGQPGGNPSLMVSPPQRRLRQPATPQRRRRWGTYRHGADIGFEREVTLEIESTRILVGGKYLISTTNADRKHLLFDQVVETIDKHVRSWGMPPQKFYWVPSIRLIVHPDGHQYSEQMQSMLKQLGLSTKVVHQSE